MNIRVSFSDATRRDDEGDTNFYIFWFLIFFPGVFSDGVKAEIFSYLGHHQTTVRQSNELKQRY